jgi:hypothetical protein
MDFFGDDEIARLLRLKRYKQPSPGGMSPFRNGGENNVAPKQSARKMHNNGKMKLPKKEAANATASSISARCLPG